MKKRLLSTLIAGILLSALVVGERYAQLLYTKQKVFKTAQSLPIVEAIKESALTEKQQQAHAMFEVGQHFIIGYEDIDELKQIIEIGGVGGVFITKQNIAGKTKEEIRETITSLQAIQTENKLPPLFIATDQEGGPVARMTPPLSPLPPLASLIDQSKCTDEIDSCFTQSEQEAVRQYAKNQGLELKELGINLNFAPVVDVYGQAQVKNDKYTHLNLRALGSYAWLIKAISDTYIAAQEEEGILPTHKHFPGLGSVTKDTHIASAHVTKSQEELEQNDWIPFRDENHASSSAIMLSHAVLDVIDKDTPTSFSDKVVRGLLREEWNYQGILLTDDFSMQPVRYSRDGVTGASVKAVNAGVDLILISFKPELYYSAIGAVLEAQEKGELNQDMLQKSHRRLEKARQNMSTL